MNKKLIFRILGALSGALIIVGCFIPFISAYGSSVSLWDQYGKAGTLYLPIMIIIFGVIAVIFFSLNIKTEFAYMTTGAVLFYVIMETVTLIDKFEFVSIGYYFLAIGSILTGVMAFLCNLKSKVKISQVPVNENIGQPSMVQQIDKLYNEQQSNVVEETPYQINNEINPIPIQPLQSTVSNLGVEPIGSQQVSSQTQPVQEVNNQGISLENNISNVPVNPVIQQFTQNPTDSSVTPVQSNQSVQPNNMQPQVTSVQNNIVDQKPIQPTQGVLFTDMQPQVAPIQNNVVEQVLPTINEEQIITQPNPVVSSFANSDQNSNTNIQSSTILAPQQSTNNNSGLDIFGQ